MESSPTGTRFDEGAAYRARQAAAKRADRLANPEKYRVANGIYRLKNKESARCYAAVWRAANPQRHRDAITRWQRSLRREVLSAYGGVCRCCGESTPEFLSIDHVNGGGRKHAKAVAGGSGTSFYMWLKKSGFPQDEFQLLCMNCNFAKGRYGVCPHGKS